MRDTRKIWFLLKAAIVLFFATSSHATMTQRQFAEFMQNPEAVRISALISQYQNELSRCSATLTEYGEALDSKIIGGLENGVENFESLLVEAARWHRDYRRKCLRSMSEFGVPRNAESLPTFLRSYMASALSLSLSIDQTSEDESYFFDRKLRAASSGDWDGFDANNLQIRKSGHEKNRLMISWNELAIGMAVEGSIPMGVLRTGVGTGRIQHVLESVQILAFSEAPLSFSEQTQMLNDLKSGQTSIKQGVNIVEAAMQRVIPMLDDLEQATGNFTVAKKMFRVVSKLGLASTQLAEDSALLGAWIETSTTPGSPVKPNASYELIESRAVTQLNVLVEESQNFNVALMEFQEAARRLF